MSLQPFSRTLRFLPAILSVWLIFSMMGLLFADPANLPLSLALLGFTVALALTGLFRYSNWVAALLSFVVYFFVQAGLKGMTIDIVLPLTVMAVALVITAWLGGWTAAEIHRLYRQIGNDQKLIEELRLYDPDTGIMRYRYVYQTLRSEVLRSQRYDKHLCVLLLKIGNQESLQEELGANELEQMKRQMLELLPASLRAMDIPFSGEKVGAILPETNLEGAQKVVARLLESVQRKLRVPLHIGIAQFPADGVTEEELMRAAEAALHVAETTGRPFVQYAQLHEATQIRPAD
ncbi:MAG: diguanylate cyclase [Anaerolineales bacterium]|nr:diguanylate cyclase [Anaerolineales bacterium]